jgi:hypothetical protein
VQKGVHAARLLFAKLKPIRCALRDPRSCNDWLLALRRSNKATSALLVASCRGTGLRPGTSPPPAERYKDRRCGGPHGGSRSKSAKFRLTSHLHVPHDSEALQDPYGVRQPVWSASDRITASESPKSAHFGALMFLIPFVSTAGTGRPSAGWEP